MTQTEPDIALQPPVRKKGKRLLWSVLTIVILAGAGSVALTDCPFLYPSSVTVLNPTPDIESLNRRVENLESKVNALTSTAATSSVNASDSSLAETVKNMQAQIDDMRSQGGQGQQVAQKWVAAAMAFWELREAAQGGYAFAPQLAVLRANADDDAALLEQARKLEPFADEAVPTLAQLRETLTAQESALATPVENNDQTIWGRIKAIFRPLISVRPLHNISFTALENALVHGDEQAALDAFRNLSDETQKKLSVWKNGLEKRVASDAALHDMAAIFIAPATPGVTP